LTEFVRGYVLPDLARPRPEDLLSLLLVWDELAVEEWSDENEPTDEGGFYSELKSAGVVREYSRFINIAAEVDPALSDHPTSGELLQRARENADALVDGLTASVNNALLEAADQGRAPLALTYFAELVSALPPPEPLAPVAEASMIQVAAQGIRVDRDTGVADVLRFREKNQHLMGRFRGAMIDLAASIQADTPTKATEQAYATLVNRVEPALGDLTTALKRGRINFAVTTLIGATSLSLSPIDPATKTVAGGHLLSRSLRYAFDRDRVVRDHPYGLIYRAQKEFGVPLSKSSPAVIDDPISLMRQICTLRVMLFLRELQSKIQANKD
jgi:hypothetical protein